MSTGAFVATSRFKVAIQLYNNMEQKLFDKVISTICQRHNPKTGIVTFSEQELDQLKQLLSVNTEQLDILMNCCSYILDQSAFFNLTADKLAAQLQTHELQDSKAQSFGGIWSTIRGNFMSQLREKTFGAPLCLNSIDWSLKLTTSAQHLASTKQLNCAMSLGLVDANDKTQQDNIELEFSKDELVMFFDKLEVIQQQLDAISK